MPLTGEIVANLARLPPELAFDILDDLRLWDILKLIQRGNDRINSLIIGSPRYKTLVGEDPTTTCKKVKEYMDFAARWQLKLCYDPDHFEHHKFTERFDPKGRYGLQYRWSIIGDLHTRIWHEMPRLYYQGTRDLLVPYTEHSQTKPKLDLRKFESDLADDKYNLDKWKDYWSIVAEAKAVLSRKCSDQILEAARLLEENPDILKRGTDPDQKPRPNIAHIVSRMRQVAERLPRRTVKDFRSVEYLKYHFFAVVPFDSALERLLFLMEKHKFSSGDQLLDHHPPAIMSLARMVVDGIPYLYSQDPVRPAGTPLDSEDDTKTIYSRTVNTPWSPNPSEKDEETSGSPRLTDWKKSLHSWRRTTSPDVYGPHSQLEENWVGCFVELYRALEKLENEQS